MSDSRVQPDLKYEQINAAFLDADLMEAMDFYILVEYQGFDPEITFKALVAKAAALGKSMKQFALDMEKICIFYARRGTSYDRGDFDARSKNKAGDAVRRLMNEYGIKANLGTNLAPDQVSVARVIIVFAEVVAAVYGARLQRPIVVSDKLPIPFSFPAGASLMTDTEWNTYKEPFLDMMVAFTKIINARKSRTATTTTATPTTGIDLKNDEAIRSYQLTIAENARNSAFTKKHLAAKKTRCNILIKALRTAYLAKHSDQKDSDLDNPVAI